MRLLLLYRVIASSGHYVNDLLYPRIYLSQVVFLADIDLEVKMSLLNASGDVTLGHRFAI